MKNKINTNLNKYKKMPQPIKASFWFTFSNILSKGIALLATPIFTRLLTTDEYGIYTVFQSWSGILIIFTSLNLFMGAFGTGLVEFSEDRDRFTSSLFGLTTVITSIAVVIYLCNISFWTHVLGISSTNMIAMFIMLYMLPAFEFWATRQRFEYEYFKLVVATLGMTIGSIMLGIIFVLLTENKIEARIYSDLLVKAAIQIPLVIFIAFKGKVFFNKKYWNYALWFNIPLIPHFLSSIVLNQSDRIMIQRMVDSSSAAMYGVAYTIGTVVLLVVNAINNSFTPYTYQALKNKQYRGIKRNADLLVVFVATMVSISMIFTPEAVLIFAGRKYYEAIWVIPPVATSVFFIFLYSLLSNIQYYYKKTTYIALASIICAILNIILNFIFIPKIGYLAAGYITLICYIMYTCTHLYFCRKVLLTKGINLIEIYSIKKYLYISVGVLLVMIVVAFTYNFPLIRYFILIIILITIVINKSIIVKLLKKIIKKDVDIEQ